MQSLNARSRPISITWSRFGIRESLFDTLFPNADAMHRVIACAVLVAFIFACAKARFYLPENPTPVTLQTFGVLLSGGIMGWRWGIGAITAYIALGALGLPMFAGSDPLALRTPLEAWQQTLTGVTGGYIIGFVLAAAAVGLLSQMGFTHSRSIWPAIIGGLILYIPALIWLATFDFGWPAADKLFEQGMYLYMPGDMIKMLVASLVLSGLWNYGASIIDVIKSRFSRVANRV